MEIETKKKISESLKKRFKSGMCNWNKGKHLTEDFKSKLRVTIKSKWNDGTYAYLIGSKLSEEHKDKISNAVKERWTDPIYREKNTNSVIKYWSDPEHRRIYSELAKLRWEDEEYRQKTIAAIRILTSSDEYREVMRQHGIRRSSEISEMFKKLWSNKEWREKQIIKLSANIDKELLSKISRERWNDPKFYEKMFPIMSRNFSDPKRMENLRKVMVTSEYRMKIRESVKKVCSNPEFRKKMSEISKKRWENKEYREKMAVIRINQPKTSTQQKILYSFLDDLKIKYFSDNSIECKIGFYTFDCRIDPQPNIKLNKPLLIEVQGDYWHKLEKNIRQDRSKATYLRSYYPEFDLKYLWEHEFDNRDRITNLLKYWLGLKEQELVNFDFKQVTERLIDYKEAELFISKYHYAGRIGRSGVNFGYYLNDELIAVIVYANPIRQEVAIKQGYAYKEVLELSRLAIHPNYQVKNLASHLISRSINYIKKDKLDIKLLVSFADNTYNHSGVVYKASNWTLDGEVAPDYWYADDRGYMCHKKTLWNKASKNSLTESEYCSRHNYTKIYGDKKYRYIFKLDTV